MYTIRPSDGVVTKSMGAVWTGLTRTCCCFKKGNYEHWLDPAYEKYDENLVTELKALFASNGLLILFVPMISFWTLFTQIGGAWIIQSKRMNGYVTENWYVKPGQMKLFNTFGIITLAPIFDYIVYPLFARVNLLKKTTHRMILGMFLMVLAFIYSGTLSLTMDSYPDGTVHRLWQTPQYIIMTTAEVLVSISGLELSYTQAPPSLKSVVMALWFLPAAFANGINAFQSSVFPMPETVAFFVYAGFQLFWSIVFLFISRKFVSREERLEMAREPSLSTQETSKSEEILQEEGLGMSLKSERA